MIFKQCESQDKHKLTKVLGQTSKTLLPPNQGRFLLREENVASSNFGEFQTSKCTSKCISIFQYIFYSTKNTIVCQMSTEIGVCTDIKGR